jgi:hypothetical protein
MDTTPNTPSPASAQASTKLAAKSRHKPIERFPLRFHCAITIAMGDALKQSTGDNSLLSESDIGRLALHSWFMANNPRYARLMGNGNSNAA